MEPPSGRQFELRHATQRAVVVEVGGGLREYVVEDRPLLDGYPLERMADGGRGQPLLPWPNRLRDGQYTFGEQTLQLPIEEVERHNAMHGLTRWLNWSAVDQSADHVTLELTLHPRPGYPFTLQLLIDYALGDAGLTVRTTARNAGQTPLPFGAGQHPYFTVSTSLIDEATLQLHAGGRVELDPERRLPTGRTLPIANTDLDFRSPRVIGSQILDDCFCDLGRDADGRAHVRLSSSETRRSVSVWMDAHYRYAQVFSGDTLASARRRTGLAIEPMTCPPDAFRSGTDLIVLAPGEAVQLAWGVEFTMV